MHWNENQTTVCLERLYQYTVEVVVPPHKTAIVFVISSNGVSRADSAARRCSDGEDGFDWPSVGPKKSDWRNLDDFQDLSGRSSFESLFPDCCIVLGGLGEADGARRADGTWLVHDWQQTITTEEAFSSLFP